MKLILAIIQDEDAHEVISALNDAKFQVTRLNTKGGFLRAGNTTLMTGVPAEKVEEALTIIEENSKARILLRRLLLLRWVPAGNHASRQREKAVSHAVYVLYCFLQ